MSPLSSAFAGLALPVLLGLLAGGLRLFPDPGAAIGALNRFALYIAFPALIAVGLTGVRLDVPATPAFWLVPPAAMTVTAALAWLVARGPFAGQAGTLTLAGITGNVAYIGLTLCERLLGEQVLGLASLAVALFATSALALGPALLLRWSGHGRRRSVASLLLRQPLLWSPFLGLGLRATPWRDSAHALLEPVGHSAAPVALFLLGLYLHTHRRAVTLDLAALAHAAVKLLLFPAVVGTLCLFAHHSGWLDTAAVQVFLILAATPTAIAAFALSVEFEAGEDRVAQTIVLSTVISAFTLPVVAGWAHGLS